MNSSDEPDPPGANRLPAAGVLSENVRASGPRLIHRQRMIAADWREVEDFLGRIPPVLASFPYSICLLSDRAIRRYNERFRQKNEATDVLSFPTGRIEPWEEDYLGDILISVETAQRNAGRLGLRVEDEIKALILHGLLHLLGQDHERDGGQMARNERRWAVRLGLTQNLLDRKQRSVRARRRSLRRGSGKRSRQRPM